MGGVTVIMMCLMKDLPTQYVPVISFLYNEGYEGTYIVWVRGCVVTSHPQVSQQTQIALVY